MPAAAFPVAFGEPDSVPAAANFAAAVAAELEAMPDDARPRRLAIEPGRALVAGSGWIVASVLHVKQRDPLIVVLDAGMTELIRPALYGAEHPMLALTSRGQPVEEDAATDSTTVVQIHGPICESTDRLGTARNATTSARATWWQSVWPAPTRPRCSARITAGRARQRLAGMARQFSDWITPAPEG